MHIVSHALTILLAVQVFPLKSWRAVASTAAISGSWQDVSTCGLLFVQPWSLSCCLTWLGTQSFLPTRRTTFVTSASTTSLQIKSVLVQRMSSSSSSLDELDKLKYWADQREHRCETSSQQRASQKSFSSPLRTAMMLFCGKGPCWKMKDDNDQHCLPNTNWV